MLSLNKFKYFNFLFYILPFTLIFSPAISTFIVSILAILGMFWYVKKKSEIIHIQYFIYFFLTWCVYIIITSFLSHNILLSFESTLFYFRFIFFSFFIYLFLKYKKNFVFEFFLIVTISILLLDSSIQYFFGENILGKVSPSDRQITSFFELKRVLGSYLSRFSPILIIIAIQSYKKNNFIFYTSIIIYIYSFFGVIISGERVSLFYYLFVIFFLFLVIKIKLSYKILLFLIFSLLFTSIILQNPKLKERIISVSLNQYVINDSFTVKETKYYSLLRSSFVLFKDNFIFGVGPKNFREECKISKIENGCSTHPHNTYVQILTETGILGLIFFLIFYFFISYNFFKYFFIITFSKNFHKVNLILFISLLNIFVNFFPFVPNGNFFGSWLSIFYYFPIGYFFYSFDKKLSLK